MANPPITVGELADVPAPGSSVASAYHVELANRVVQRFATVAARDANYAAAQNGAMCVTLDTGTVWVRQAGVWVSVTVAATNWVAMTLLAPWVNYGQGFAVAAYRRVGDMVQVRGLIRASPTPSSASQFVILPAGYRAPYTLQFGTDGAAAHALCQIDTSGSISLLQPMASSAALNINIQYSLTA